MALARLSLLKSTAFLKLESTDYDAELKALLVAATRTIHEYTGRILEQATYTDERYTGHSDNKLYPEQFPVTALSSVSIWDTSTETFVSESTGYFDLLDERMIYYPKLGETDNAEYSSWPTTPNGIKITYTAGYTTTDWDSQIVTITVTSLTTAPAVGDVLTQANTGGTITVTSASTATNTITGTLGGTGLLNTSDNITSDDAGVTMAPTPIVPTEITNELTAALGTVPTDVEYACCVIADLAWKEGRGSEGRRGLIGIRAAEGSMAMEKYERGIPPEVETILDKYVRAAF